MNLTPTETQFIALIRFALSGGSLPEITDYAALFDLARQQKLLPILFEALRQSPAATEHSKLFAAAKQQVIGQVLNQTMRATQFAALYRLLRVSGLHPIVVKGALCSPLYPWADYRISGDDDLLIPDGELLTCHRVLLEQGLSTVCTEDSLESEDEITYIKAGSPLHIELHRRLFDSSEDAHDEFNGFFVSVHQLAVEIGGLLAMPPHEHLLYLILHAYKHFVRSGIGLRQFCDIGLWAQKYHNEINWALLHDQCQSVRAATFAATVFVIARQHLGIAFDLPAQWETKVSAEPLLNDTLCGGVYGTNDLTRLHSSTVTLNAVKSSRAGKRSNILASVFPNRRYMERQYPYVKKSPLLLPVAWGQRLTHYLYEKHHNKDNSAAASLQLAKERIDLMKLYEIIE